MCVYSILLALLLLESFIMTILVKQLNDANLCDLYKFEVAGQHVGYLRPALADVLIKEAPFFLGQVGPTTISVIAENLSAEQLTAQFKALHEKLAAQGLLPKPVNEFSDVRAHISNEPICQINRSLIFPFGIISRGVHAILRYENGDFVIAKRSNKVFTFQGCYDVSVGGLLPSGKDPWDHVKVEAQEEGNISGRAISPAGDVIVLSYVRNIQGKQNGTEFKPAFPFETDGGTNWDEVFCWTVIVSDKVIPTPNDGEVKSFERMTTEQLLRSLREEPEKWKTNSGVMLFQELARDPRSSSLLTPEEHSDLQSILIKDPRPLNSRGELVLKQAKTPASNRKIG